MVNGPRRSFGCQLCFRDPPFFPLRDGVGARRIPFIAAHAEVVVVLTCALATVIGLMPVFSFTSLHDGPEFQMQLQRVPLYVIEDLHWILFHLVDAIPELPTAEENVDVAFFDSCGGEGVAFVELLHLYARRDQDVNVGWDALANAFAPLLAAPLALQVLQSLSVEVVQEA